LTLIDEKVFSFGENQISIPIDGTFLDKNLSGQSYPLPQLPTNLSNVKEKSDLLLFIS
jgi:hypothetical protein